MDKAKNGMIIAIAVLAVVCIFVVAYASTASSQLNAERAKASGLEARVADLEKRLTDANTKLNNQTAANNNLQGSLDALRIDADGLRADKAGLESKLDAAVKAMKAAQESASKIPAAGPAPVPAAQ